jgi:subtilisin family serine protease
MRTSLTLILLVSACMAPGTDPSDRAQELGASRRYLVIGDDIPPGLGKMVFEGGGTVRKLLPEAGVAIVTSPDPGFVGKARKLRGVTAVVPDIRLFKVEPAEEAFVELAAPLNLESWDKRGAPGKPGREVRPPPAYRPFDPVWDFGYPYMWALQAVNARAAWDRGNFGQGVRVAVLDTGTVSYHPDLARSLNQDLSVSFVVDQDNNVQPWDQEPFNPSTSYHGMWVSGIIAAAPNNGYAVGVAPGVEIVAVKVLDDQGSGTLGALLEGIIYAGTIRADVANISLGGPVLAKGGCIDGYCATRREVNALIKAQQRAVDSAHRSGTTIVAATGNRGTNVDGTDILILPAQLDHVIGVSATSPRNWALDPAGADFDQPTSYSNHGKELVDFSAPGGDWTDFGRDDTLCDVDLIVTFLRVPCGYLDQMLSSYGLSTGIMWLSGTSGAAPYVAGLAALEIAASGRRLDPDEVEALLRKHAVDAGRTGIDAFHGKGSVRAVAPERCMPPDCRIEGRSCGTIPDPCSGTTVSCGTCDDTQVCTDNVWCCTPRTCADSYAPCGEMDDGCGGKLDCGTCPDTQVCTDANDCCTPMTCASYGATCGEINDGCGGTVSCGTCENTDVCSFVWCCTPWTCADVGAACGEYYDGCGGAMSCGTCPDPQVCSGNQCCTPQTCAEVGAACGEAYDGCSEMVSCGTCPDPQVCSGNQCCTPLTCADHDSEACGNLPDGCGATITCGECPPHHMTCGCYDGTRIEVCPRSNCNEASARCDEACSFNGGRPAAWSSCEGADPTCEPAFRNDASGPDLLSCSCPDGKQFEICATSGDWLSWFWCGWACYIYGYFPTYEVEPNAPVCTGAEAPPEGPYRLTCTCNDTTGVEACTTADVCGDSFEMARACNPYCSTHGGLAQSSCDDTERADCESATYPKFGTDLATCRCADQTTVELCTVSDCDPEQQSILARDCRAACGFHGGLIEASCAPEGEVCTGAVLPPGEDVTLECFCADWTRIHVCTAAASASTSLKARSVCSSVCATHDGLRDGGAALALGCRPAYDPLFGSDQLRCTCADGSQVDFCGEGSDGGTRACAQACHGRGGTSAASSETGAAACAGDEVGLSPLWGGRYVPGYFADGALDPFVVVQAGTRHADGVTFDISPLTGHQVDDVTFCFTQVGAWYWFFPFDMTINDVTTPFDELSMSRPYPMDAEGDEIAADLASGEPFGSFVLEADGSNTRREVPMNDGAVAALQSAIDSGESLFSIGIASRRYYHETYAYEVAELANLRLAVSVDGRNAGDDDGDGVRNACDNCPAVANPDQSDLDADGAGDACDICPRMWNPGEGQTMTADDDGDGVPNSCDNCPAFASPDTSDADGDGVGDACDSCPNAWNPGEEQQTADRDADGRPDACDNCPDHPNPDQADSNGDGRGDACPLMVSSWGYPSPQLVGEVLYFGVGISNLGGETVTGARLFARLPPGVTLVDFCGPDGSCFDPPCTVAGETVVCELPDLLPYSWWSSVILHVLAPMQPGTIRNSGSVEADSTTYEFIGYPVEVF